MDLLGTAQIRLIVEVQEPFNTRLVHSSSILQVEDFRMQEKPILTAHLLHLLHRPTFLKRASSSTSLLHHRIRLRLLRLLRHLQTQALQSIGIGANWTIELQSFISYHVEI